MCLLRSNCDCLVLQHTSHSERTLKLLHMIKLRNAGNMWTEIKEFRVKKTIITWTN